MLREQLEGIFTVIFNLSLSQSVIPTIITVPKNYKASCHKDFCPVALSSVIMKCFERLVMAHINSTVPATLDLLHFAYFPNRSINDANSIALLTTLTHLEKINTYVRILFIDYSSAFNTIGPSMLVTKLRLWV